MSKPPSLAGVLALILFCGISYGLGTGWIRIGPTPPAAGPANGTTQEPGGLPISQIQAFLQSSPQYIDRRQTLDPTVRRTELQDPPATTPPPPTPGTTAAPTTVGNPDPLTLSKVPEAITANVTASVTKVVAAVLADDKVSKPIADGKLLTEDPDAAASSAKTAAQTAAQNAATPVITTAVNANVVAKAKGNSDTAVQTAALAAAQEPVANDVLDNATAAALSAAVTAMNATLTPLIKPRDAIADDDFQVTFENAAGTAITPDPKDPKGTITDNGPTVNVKVALDLLRKGTSKGRKFDDTGSDLQVKLTPTQSGKKPYLPVSVVPPFQGIAASALTSSGDAALTKGTLTIPIKINEAMAYSIDITLTPKDNSRAAMLKSIAIQITPTLPKALKISGISESQDNRKYSIDMTGTSAIELRTGQPTLTAALTPLDKETRRLIGLNVDSNTPLKLRNGSVQTRDVSTDSTVDFPVDIPPEDLTDKPTRLAIVDLWSRQTSDAITVVIPGGGDGLPSSTSGIRAKTGPNPAFGEYTDPRTLPNGFKPSDKVETRVARLYYYRDAHRVAQIVNRDVQSYNRVAVDTRRRMADRARKEADDATDTRRVEEVRAVRAAQATRSAEAKVKQLQNDLDTASRNEQRARQDAPVIDAQIQSANDAVTQQSAQVAALQQQLSDAKAASPPDQTLISRLTAQYVEATVKRGQLIANQSALTQQKTDAQSAISGTKSDDLRKALDKARSDLETLRNTESQLSDETLRGQQIEDRSRENQFRQEVAAAHEDPDTYVPGKPNSKDPVLQVSVSVIGEGLIQLRGPIKGINVIRTMINQIDAPASQVRVGIHTIQINGERGDRMEKVATKIQDYVDHSRFLTTQSAQMLRNSVVKIASIKAEQAAAACLAAGDQSQQSRDAKYQEAFFGKDFVNELREIDSEFLMTGNKLLSIHSMDTTSLASALFLLALAKNDIREEILNEFQRAMQGDLPRAEVNYYNAGAVGRDNGHGHGHKNDFKMMSGNAKFQSFLGFFNANVAGSETLNPLQREFLKLAQIFKSRLVTELEYQQRVKERGLIEERINPAADLALIKQKEDAAAAALDAATQAVRLQREAVFAKLASLQHDIENSRSEVSKLSVAWADYHAPDLFGQLHTQHNSDGTLDSIKNQALNLIKKGITLKIREGVYYNFSSPPDEKIGPPIPVEYPRSLTPTDITNSNTTKSAEEDVKKIYDNLLDSQRKAVDLLNDFMFSGLDYQNLQSIKKSFDLLELPDGTILPTQSQLASLLANAKLLQQIAIHVQLNVEKLSRDAADRLIAALSDERIKGLDLFNSWLYAKQSIRNLFRTTGQLRAKTEATIRELDDGFQTMLQKTIANDTAAKLAAASRRPLDHKRLLDMLIDDVEDKYIELLEGTRSHTANIDAYIKNIATALDDDFNTQYYYPAMTEVRRASRYYDVSLGKIETTNVLANNRGFGKVEPQATMEFDLPKRDILINEAMNGALAMTKDFGALMNDPTFLATAKLRSGQPTSSLEPGAGLGVNSVRNVLPGLSRANDENLLSQQGAGRSGFGSAMEALIPDPAVYKFETGTGFEIRPVVQPDGQSVVFHFNYMYTTNVREPVRADEKHLGRVKRHFIDTDVQLGNYELREVSRYQVGLKASRTSKGVPLFEDIPGLGILFRPLPSAESSLQENIVLAQGTIFPTLFDLMGLRWAPAVADLDTLRLRNDDFVVRNRARDVANKVFDISSSQVDEFLRVPADERRPDLYRTQRTIPDVHPNGYRGPGMNFRDSHLREDYNPLETMPETPYVPDSSRRAVLPPAMPEPLPDETGAVIPPLPDGAMGDRRTTAPRVATRPVPSNRATPRTAIPGPARPTTPVRPPSTVPLNGPTSSYRPSPTINDPSVKRASATLPQGLPPLPGSLPTSTKPRAATAPATKPEAAPRRGLISRLRGTSE